MRIFDWNTLTDAERRSVLARPAQESRADIAAVALEVVNAVRRNGDAALRSYTERFDSVRLDKLAVSEEEFSNARSALTPQQLAALERAIENVQRFHAAQLPQPLSLETTPGVRCERIIRPISTVGLYVPAGSAPFLPPLSCWQSPRASPDAHTGSCALHQCAMDAQIPPCS